MAKWRTSSRARVLTPNENTDKKRQDLQTTCDIHLFSHRNKQINAFIKVQFSPVPIRHFLREKF